MYLAINLQLSLRYYYDDTFSKTLETIIKIGHCVTSGNTEHTPCFNHPYCHTLMIFFDIWMKSICTEVTHKYPIVSKFLI